MKIPQLTLCGALLLSLTSCQTSEVDCECFSPAVEMNAIGPGGLPVALDSVHAFSEGERLSATAIPSSITYAVATSALSVGTKAGQYKLVAFYKSEMSDTVVVDVKFDDKTSCRTLSTKSVQFTFDPPNRPTTTVQEPGGCSHATL